MKLLYLFFGFCWLFFSNIFVQETKAASIAKPFNWQYDVIYTRGKLKYKGVGAYILEPQTQGNLWTFSYSVTSNNNLFSSKSELTFRYDDEHILIPLSRLEKTVILGFPKTKNIAITPQKGAYYDTLSAILLILNDLDYKNKRPGAPNKWKLWMADSNKWETFYLGVDEVIFTPRGGKDCYVVLHEESNLKVWITKDENYIAKMNQNRAKENTLMNIISIN